MRQHDDDWRLDAACRNKDPELFFPTGKGPHSDRQVTAAKTVCARCPVRRECRDYANSVTGLEGVFGGLFYPDERPRTPKPPTPKAERPAHESLKQGGPPADRVIVDRLIAGKPTPHTAVELNAAIRAMADAGATHTTISRTLHVSGMVVAAVLDETKVNA